MFIKLTRYGEGKLPYTVNLDHVLNWCAGEDNRYTIVRIADKDAEGKSRSLWVNETVEELDKRIAHFMLKSF